MASSGKFILRFFVLLLSGIIYAQADESSPDHNHELGKSIAGERITSLRHRLETPRPDDVMVIAHRACWKKGPENSLAAMQACIHMDVDMIETDVRRSKDGHLVIMHDETVDRMTDGHGRVEELTLAELKAFRLREHNGGPGAGLTDQKIPTLAEALQVMKGYVLVNLDTKADLLADALSEVHKLGMEDQILFKSSLPGNDPSLRTLPLSSGIYFMPIVRQARGTLGPQVKGFDWANPIAFEVVFQDEDYLERNAGAVTGQRVRLWVNSMWKGLAGTRNDADALTDPDAHWGYLLSRGVTMIQTDEPEALLAYLRNHGLRRKTED